MLVLFRRHGRHFLPPPLTCSTARSTTYSSEPVETPTTVTPLSSTIRMSTLATCDDSFVVGTCALRGSVTVSVALERCRTVKMTKTTVVLEVTFATFFFRWSTAVCASGYPIHLQSLTFVTFDVVASTVVYFVCGAAPTQYMLATPNRVVHGWNLPTLALVSA